MPALAAMSVINPAFSQNLEARPKKVVLLPPQIFVFELSAGDRPAWPTVKPPRVCRVLPRTHGNAETSG